MIEDNNGLYFWVGIGIGCMLTFGLMCMVVNGAIVLTQDKYCSRDQHVYSQEAVLEGLNAFKCLHCDAYRKATP